MPGRIKGAGTLTSSTPIDPALWELLAERFGANAPRPSAAVIPNFGGFASFVEQEARAEFYRFWVYELLDEELVRGFPLEAAYPDRIPPTLPFTEAAVQRHRHEPKSRAYLFALNLLVTYALGWLPERPLYPLGPWEAGSEGASRAREVLVTDIFKKKISKVAWKAFKQWSPRDVRMEDVRQEANLIARRLISGETLDEMARNVAKADTWERRNDPALDPLEFRLTQGLQEAYKRALNTRPATHTADSERELRSLVKEGEQFILVPLAGTFALFMRRNETGYSGQMVCLNEPTPPVDALRLVLLARRDTVDALESGEKSSGKSFWVHHDANLVTHLFGLNFSRGRLLQELRDWLHRKVMSDWKLRGLKDNLSPTAGESRPTLSEEEFDRIDWRGLIGNRAATPLNIAIIKARQVYDLSGGVLRNYLADQGLQPPSADAIRQRLRYLKKLLEPHRKQ